MDELLNTAPCGFLSFTDDGTIRAVNGTLAGWLGYDVDGLTGRKIDVVLPVASRIFYQTHFFPLMKLHGHAEEVFLTLSAHDGSPVPTLSNAVRRVRDDQPITDCVFLPVHQRKRYEYEILQAKRDAEEALRNNLELVEAKRQLQVKTEALDQHVLRLLQRNHELSRLSQIVAHDLREPLRKMSVFADILEEEDQNALTRWGKRAVERIKAGAAQLDELLRGLQHLLALDSTTGQVAAVPLEEVVQAAYDHLYDTAPGKEVEFQVSDLPVVEGHRERLVLMFTKLIENSLKFCTPQEAARVHIRGQVVQYNRFQATEGRYRYVDFAEVFYTDNSIGFEERHATRVFEIFAKLDSSSEGPGLGLSVARKVAELHNGSISVESRPGEGVTFRIALPLQHLR